MRKVLGVSGVLVLVLLFALAGCKEAGEPITAKMLEGTWEFNEGWEIFFLEEIEGIIDADVDTVTFDGENKEYTRITGLHVELKSNTLVGTYDADGVADKYTITITMTYINETLSLQFSGGGSLDKLHLTGGKKID